MQNKMNRRNLIAEIAQRHAAQRQVTDEFFIENENLVDASENDYESIVEQEFNNLITLNQTTL